MGMKRFTSHRGNPTTIRAIRICMRGMFFLPFCLCCETLLRWPPELLQALSGAENVLPCFNSANGWTIDPDRPCHWRVVRCPQRSCASWKSSCRDGLAETTVLFLQSNPRPIFRRVSARLLLRGPSQNLLGCLLRSHERRYRNRQLRRNEPYLHAWRIQRRFMIPSQAIVVLRGAGHVLGPESW